jgi:type II secretory pathway component PulK
MIILLVLGIILVLSYPLGDAFYSSWQTRYAVENIYRKERSLIFLHSALKKVVKLLNEDKNGYDSLNELWAKPFYIETPLGSLEIKIVDLDRFINLNAVGRNPKVTQIFENLLLLLNIDDSLIDYLTYWNGARKSPQRYIGKYPIKGKPLDSKYELLYFWNNTADLYGKKVGEVSYPGLLELTTVHSDGKININTAPYWVLRSLSVEIDDYLARKIMATREEKPFRSPRDLLRVEGITMNTLYSFYSLLKTSSRYFKITLRLKEGDYAGTLEAVYDRQRRKIVEKRIY